MSEKAAMEALEQHSDIGHHNDQKDSGITLHELPEELIIHIGGFLQPDQLSYSLCGVNQRLNKIFGDDLYWRTRIKQKWPEQYPIIPDRVPVPSIWKRRCHARESQYNMFARSDNTMNNKMFPIGQGGLVGGDVNAMCFINDGKLLCTGGRDRQVIIWDIEMIKKGAQESSPNDSNLDCQRILHTHAAWVWSLRCNRNLLSSGAWDSSICICDLNHHSAMGTSKEVLKTSGSVTCHGWEEDRLIAGTFIGGVELFDRRSGLGPVSKKSQSHHHAVLGVHLDGDRVIVVGADKKLQILDLRANEFLCRKSIPNNDYGTQLCVENGNIWIGTKRGHVFLYDQDDFNLVDDLTTAIGHTSQITGLHCDAGHILTCAMDRSTRMSHPTKSAGGFWRYYADSGFTAMDFAKNYTLALAWGPAVGMWWPKNNG